MRQRNLMEWYNYVLHQVTSITMAKPVHVMFVHSTQAEPGEVHTLVALNEKKKSVYL